MKLYHGSEIKGLKSIRSEFFSEDGFEGQMIYLTDSFEVAKDYAGDKGSVYEVEVGECLDLTSKEKVEKFLMPVFEKLNIDFNSLEYLDAGTNHVLNHHGKNGVWSLGLDVSQVLKFEPKFKARADLKELTSFLEKEINAAIQAHETWKIRDNDNKANIYIHNAVELLVVKENQ